MVVESAVVAKITAAILGALAAKFRESAEESARARVDSLLSSKSRRRAVEVALGEALAAVEAKHGEVVGRAGFDAGFLEHEAASELARALVVGDRPDDYAIAEAWAGSFISATRAEKSSDDRKRRAKFIAMAVEPAELLVESFVAALGRQSALDELTDRNRDITTAANSEVLARASGRAPATSRAEHQYLSRVAYEHRWLSTAGRAHWTHNARIPLDEVYVCLAVAEDLAPGDETDRFLVDAEAELEARYLSERLGAEAYEAELDRLHLQRRTPSGRSSPAVAVAALEVARTHDRLVVLGSPGAGKSTLLQYLAATNAQAVLRGETEIVDPSGTAIDARFPIWAKLGDLPRGGEGWVKESLIEFLVRDHAKSRNYGIDELYDLFETHLKAGDCVVLFDAFDEIPSADDRRDVRDAVASFVDTWAPRGNRFIVTSRPYGYRAGMLSGFDHYRVEDMSPDQVAQFLNHYCTAVERSTKPGTATAETDGLQAAAEISAAIEANEGIARLAVNPLLLSILVLVHANGRRIPDKRAEVYDHATEALEESWRFAMGVPRDDIPPRALLRRTLTELAAWLHTKPTGAATRTEIRDHLAPSWAAENNIAPNPNGTWPATLDTTLNTFLDGTMEHTGLLVEKAPGRLGFFHQTFQEFYVAHHLLNDPSGPANAIRRHLHDPRYDEPILLALGLESHQHPARARDLFDQAILAHNREPSEFEDLLHRDRNFAYRAAGDGIELNPTTIATLAQNPLNCPQQYLPSLAGTQLGTHLANNLRSLATDTTTNSSVRFRAAEVLGDLGDTSTATLEVLRSVATDTTTDRGVRSSAAQALGNLGDTSTATLEVLRSVATDTTTDRGVRSGAARALGNLGDTSTAGEVLRSVATDTTTDRGVRSIAVEVLGVLGDTSTATLEVLRSVATDTTTDSGVRSSAVEVLGDLGDTSTATLEVLRSLATDTTTDRYVRSIAAQALVDLALHAKARRDQAGV